MSITTVDHIVGDGISPQGDPYPEEVQRFVAARQARANPGEGPYEWVTEVLTQLISAVAEQSNRLRIPAAAWVFVPAVD